MSNPIDQYMPADLQRQLRDWYKESPLGYELAVKLVLAVIGIDASLQINVNTRPMEAERMDGLRNKVMWEPEEEVATILPFPSRPDVVQEAPALKRPLCGGRFERG